MMHDETANGLNPYHDPGLAGFFAGFGYDGTCYLLARSHPVVINGLKFSRTRQAGFPGDSDRPDFPT